MQTVNEIKTLIALTGAKRIPHLESEIFANSKLTTLYLHNLCKDQSWYDGIETDEGLAYWYAHFAIKDRWPEAEAVISADHWWAYWYAKRVIKGRWLEAERIIKRDKGRWRWYSAEFGITDE